MPRIATALLLALATLVAACGSPAAPTPAPSSTTPAPTVPAPSASPAALPSPSASPIAFPSPPPIPATLKRTSVEYGMSVFVWGNPTTRARDLGAVASSEFKWQKSLFQWRAIEPTKGKFDWTESDKVVKASNDAGLKILARLDFQPQWARKDGRTLNGTPDDPKDFADFVTALVTRYKPGSQFGELQAIEVWNEPNLQREWGRPITQASAKEYVDLLGAAYTAAKAANPAVTVVTAGLSPTGWDDDTARPDDSYMRWMFDAGLAGKYDALGVHANSQAPEPLAYPGSLPKFPDASFYFRRVEQLRAIQVAAGDAAKPVWVLEFGWTSDRINPNYSWFAVTEEQKGENIVTAYKYALAYWQPWVGPMFVWTIPDPTWNQDREELWWAITNPDGTHRPAIDRLRLARNSGELP